jgi:hypothetical protein
MSTERPLAGSAKLNEEIERLLIAMSGTECDSDEYGKMTTQLVKLYQALEIIEQVSLKAQDTEHKKIEIDTQLRLREFEVRAKEREATDLTTLRKQEIESNRELKQEELSMKLREIDATCDLRRVEAASKQKDIDEPRRVSPDTWVVVGANVVGIVAILTYEKLNIITSKAVGFVMRLR